MLRINYIEQLLGQENSSKLIMGVNTLGILAIVSTLKQFELNYVTLSIQFGFVNILYSQRTSYINETKYEALLLTIIAILNAIGQFTFFAALRKFDLFTVMIVYNFKTLLINSVKLQKKIGSILFLFGFILNLMNNDTKIAIWALILGQICQTISNLLEQKIELQQSNLQLYKGIFLIMIALINFGFTSENINNTFYNYIISFLMAIIMFCLEPLKKLIIIKNEQSECFIIGLQLFVLMISNKLKIISTISIIFYFSGIFALYIENQ